MKVNVFVNGQKQQTGNEPRLQYPMDRSVLGPYLMSYVRPGYYPY